MTGRMGVLMNEDAMEDAWLANRGRQKASDTQTAGADAPAEPRMAEVVAVPAASKTETWVSLERKRRDLEAQLKATVTQQDALRKDILGQWSLTGASSEKVNGQTVHMQRKVYPKVVDRAALATAIRKEGLDHLLTVDDKAFAVFVTERDETGQPLPDSIAELIASSFERYALVVKLS